MFNSQRLTLYEIQTRRHSHPVLLVRPNRLYCECPCRNNFTITSMSSCSTTPS